MWPHGITATLMLLLRFEWTLPQAAMAILGGLALYGVRHQKLKHQTIYERRKLQQARGGRGAYAGL